MIGAKTRAFLGNQTTWLSLDCTAISPCGLTWASREKHGALNDESEFLALFVDRLGGLNAQHNTIGSNLIIDQMSRIVADLDSTADRTGLAQRDILGAHRNDALTRKTASVHDVQAMAAEKFDRGFFSAPADDAA